MAATWSGCWRTCPSMCGPPGRWSYGGMFSATWMWSRMSASESGATSSSAIASAPESRSAAWAARQLRWRQEPEVLADGVHRRRLAREQCVDLDVGGCEQRLTDDTGNDEVSVARELDELAVAQHRMTVPRRCRAVISIPSGRVNLSRRSGPRFDAEPALVDGGVMREAQEAEVLHVGAATLRPVDDVVTVAPLRRAVAAGEHASSVSHREGSALCGADEPLASTEVEDLAVDAEGDSSDHRVTGHLLHGGRIDDRPARDAGSATSIAEILGAHDDRERRSHGAVASDEVQQRVGPALGWGAPGATFDRVLRPQQRVVLGLQRRVELGTVGGIEHPVEGPHACERLGQVQPAALVLSGRHRRCRSRRRLAAATRAATGASWSTVSFCACPTKSSSSRANASRVASLRPAALASSTTFADPRSPRRAASAVSGMSRSRRDVRTSTAADDRLISQRAASQVAADSAPSAAHCWRASHAATVSNNAASCWLRRRSSSRMCADSSSPVSDPRSTSRSPTISNSSSTSCTRPSQRPGKSRPIISGGWDISPRARRDVYARLEDTCGG